MCVGNGLKHGLGTVTFSNGDRYAGEFGADAMSGAGVHTFANDQGQYEGEVISTPLRKSTTILPRSNLCCLVRKVQAWFGIC